jgi:hypothetical protein
VPVMALIMQRYLCGARPMLLCLLEHSNVEIGISKTLLGYFKCTHHECCMPVGAQQSHELVRPLQTFRNVRNTVEVGMAITISSMQVLESPQQPQETGTAMMDCLTKRYAHSATNRHGQYKETQRCKLYGRLKQKGTPWFRPRVCCRLRWNDGTEINMPVVQPDSADRSTEIYVRVVTPS